MQNMNILWAALSYIFFNYYIFKGRYYFVYSLKIYNFQKDKIIKQKGINLDNRPLYRNGKFVCTQNNIKDNKLYKKKQEQKKKYFNLFILILNRIKRMTIFFKKICLLC